MKYVMLVLLFAGLIFSGNPKLVVKPMIINDNETLPAYTEYNNPMRLRSGIIIDMCPLTSLIGISHECIAYNSVADAIGVVNRGPSSSVLNFHSANGALSFWIDDFNAFSDGGAIYPMAIATDAAPYMSFRWVTVGGGAEYCSGGWFSSAWDPSISIIGTNIMGCYGKEMPNGNICFILYGTSPFCLYYRTYDASLSTLLAQGQLSPDATYYWGWDSNITGGIAYVFYCDDALNVCYRTSTDGITWTAEQPYDLVWPNPYTNNVIDLFTGVQAAVTDSGNPVLVFANHNGDDPTYPLYSKVYVSTASGQPCTKVSSEFGATDTEAYYVGITTGGNTIGVIYLTPRNNLDDSLCWTDIYYNQSDDNGATWSGPVNRTADHTQRACIPQIAKRFDVARDRPYIIYGQTLLPTGDMDLKWAYDQSLLFDIYLMLEIPPEPGATESKTETPKTTALSVTPNPAIGHSRISYTLPSAGNVSLKIYSADGRLVRTLDQGNKTSGIHDAYLNVQDLANGAYFLKLETPAGNTSKSLIIIK
jgi:hypothetical protein